MICSSVWSSWRVTGGGAPVSSEGASVAVKLAGATCTHCSASRW
ncbi:Uncharacterised protein [Bordetella pertussis]|nr:Uncharacterised protein [Bordetella pertussis]CFW29204.1 Uncharacterised protein [Bordetella pertussis]